MRDLWRGIGIGLLVLAGSFLAIGLFIWLTPRAKENARLDRPPPKPPACDNEERLGRIRLSDGSLADVRIVRVGSTLLFVPSKWVEQYFIDRPENQFSVYESKELFNPDLHQSECPGVVHDLVLQGQTPRFGNERGSVVAFYLRGNFAPVAIPGTNGETRGVSIGVESSLTPNGVEKRFPRSSSVGRYWIRPSRDFFLAVPGPAYASKESNYATELNHLGEWLMTRPGQRENERTFFSGLGH